MSDIPKRLERLEMRSRAANEQTLAEFMDLGPDVFVVLYREIDASDMAAVVKQLTSLAVCYLQGACGDAHLDRVRDAL